MNKVTIGKTEGFPRYSFVVGNTHYDMHYADIPALRESMNIAGMPAEHHEEAHRHMDGAKSTPLWTHKA